MGWTHRLWIAGSAHTAAYQSEPGNFGGKGAASSVHLVEPLSLGLTLLTPSSESRLYQSESGSQW